MKGSRRPGFRAWRLATALLTVVGTLLLVAAPTMTARAQMGIGSQKVDKNAPIVFQADEVQHDDQLSLVIARGHVEISQGGQVVLADTVSYNQKTDTVSAAGHVSPLLPTRQA